eukprot:Lithocolla_globosa_v1_NODE_4588_length_1405_cov_3.506667.p1 type:complete len:288 gc:universal NODE_4588_length_1405_cov_3.506667:1313-450(-)
MVSETRTLQNVRVGVALQQGPRPYMEDTYSMDEKDQDWIALGVYDGHTGDYTSVCLAEQLAKTIFQRPELSQNPTAALEQGFLQLDQKILQDEEHFRASGSTANFLLIETTNSSPDDEKKNNMRVFCANAGDCRAVLASLEDSTTSELLSIDHRASDPDETERIKKAGGWVEDGRVNGSLEPSRGFGDPDYKCRLGSISNDPQSFLVTAFPQVKEATIDWKQQFVVVASDGVWAVLETEQVVELVRQQLKGGETSYGSICQQVLQKCAQSGGLVDNSTIVIAALPQK